MWASAVLLAQYLFLHKDEFRGKRCLEMGAGCGLTGIFAAFLCRNVVLTDMWPEVLENLRSNVDMAITSVTAENSRTGAGVVLPFHTAQDHQEQGVAGLCPCLVLPFNWKDSAAFMAGEGGSGGKYEVILGADVVTLGFSGRLLAKSIAACLSDGGVFYGVSPVER